MDTEALAEWMAGWRTRHVVLDRPPRGLVSGRSGDYEVAVNKHGRKEWSVVVTDIRTGAERKARAEAVQRFTDWYVITGDRDDTIPTEQIRKDWWLAHQDVGVAIPKSERSRGVDHLKALGAVQGRGVLRGVAEADVMLDEAAQALREALEVRDEEEAQ